MALLQQQQQIEKIQNYQHQLQIINKESLEQQLIQDYHGLGGMNGFNL